MFVLNLIIVSSMLVTEPVHVRPGPPGGPGAGVILWWGSGPLAGPVTRRDGRRRGLDCGLDDGRDGRLHRDRNSRLDRGRDRVLDRNRDSGRDWGRPGAAQQFFHHDVVGVHLLGQPGQRLGVAGHGRHNRCYGPVDRGHQLSGAICHVPYTYEIVKNCTSNRLI
jgi:hypothetical protein